MLDSIRRSARGAGGPAWILAGRGVYAVCQFAALAVVARLRGPEAVGDVILGLAVAVPTFAFFGGQLRIVQATDGDESLSFRAIERLGLVGHLLGLLAFAAIAAALRTDVAGWMTLMGVGLARASESWAEIPFGRLQRRRRFSAIGLSTVGKSVTGAAAVLVTLWASGSVGLAFASSAVVWLVASLTIDRRLAAAGEPAESAKRSTGETLRRAAPLATGATLSSFDAQMPRYVVESSFGARSLGVFGAMHFAAIGMLTFVIPLTYAWTPALADDVGAANAEGFAKRMRRALAFSIGLALTMTAAIVPGAAVLSMAFGNDAFGEGWTFSLVVASAALLAPAAAFEAGLRAMRGFRLLMLIQFVSLVLHAATCFAGAYRFGIDGVAGGMVVRSTVYLVLLAVAFRIVRRTTFASASATSASPETASTSIEERRIAA